MAKGKSAGRAKTDPRYWQSRIFRPIFFEGGERKESRSYSARMALSKHRHTFGLGTSNAETAAKEAAKIYSHLLAHGWQATLERFAPTYAPRPEKAVTVAAYIEEASALADVQARTLADYVRALRSIVADAFGIESTVKVKVRRRIEGKIREIEKSVDSRFDYRSGGASAWQERVGQVPLSRLTPTVIKKWKLDYIRSRAINGLDAEKAARNSANSTIRQAKALFSPEIVKAVGKSLNLPAELPFAGVKVERADAEYRSRIDAGELTRKAVADLFDTAPESLKIFLLALGAGLRAREIDFLEWRSFDFEAGLISIEPTEFYRLKTKKSARAVKIDPELGELFRGWRARATGRFVIESDRKPKPGASYQTQRAKDAFERLYRWLKSNGVTARKAVHELRKEAGSLLNQKAGIYAAMRALGHSRIDTTASFYLDQKEKVAVGIGEFLSPKVIPFEAGKEAANG